MPGSIELIGTAGEVGRDARAGRRPLTAASTATSLTVPQVPQSGQRPTHLAVTWSAFRAAVLRTRFGHRTVTVTVVTDRLPRSSCRAARGFDGTASSPPALSRLLVAPRLSPAEIGTATVASPAFSNVNVKLYVRPLVIGFGQRHRGLDGLGLLAALPAGLIWPSGLPTTALPAGAVVAFPVIATVPTSEVIETRLVVDVGRVR